jgi:hypothetical protein
MIKINHFVLTKMSQQYKGGESYGSEQNLGILSSSFVVSTYGYKLRGCEFDFRHPNSRIKLSSYLIQM